VTRDKRIAWQFASSALIAVVFVLGNPGAAVATSETRVFGISPVHDRTCIAVAIAVEQDQALAGLRWYNNDASSPFPCVMAVAGYEGTAPQREDAFIVVEGVFGGEDSWSELVFDTIVASPTSCIYVIFQLPAVVQTVERGVGPGIGFDISAAESSVFLSLDGEHWLRLVKDRKLLVEPVYVSEIEKSPQSIVMLPMPSQDGAESGSKEVAGNVPKPSALYPIYPNPFNPAATIGYEISEPGSVEVSIYDLRGRRVRRFMRAGQRAGYHEIRWSGDDEFGARVASGVYLFVVRSGEFSARQTAVLLK